MIHLLNAIDIVNWDSVMIDNQKLCLVVIREFTSNVEMMALVKLSRAVSSASFRTYKNDGGIFIRFRFTPRVKKVIG